MNPTQWSSRWSFKLFNPFYTHLQFIWTQVSNINTPRPRNAITIRLQARWKSRKGTQPWIKKKTTQNFSTRSKASFSNTPNLAKQPSPAFKLPTCSHHVTSTIPGVSTSASKTRTHPAPKTTISSQPRSLVWPNTQASQKRSMVRSFLLAER